VIKALTLLHHEALVLAQRCRTFFSLCEPLLAAQIGNLACSWPPLDTLPSLSGVDVHHPAASGRDEGGCEHRPAAKTGLSTQNQPHNIALKFARSGLEMHHNHWNTMMCKIIVSCRHLRGHRALI